MIGGALTVYRGCTPVVDASYDEAIDQSPTDAVINAMSKAAGVDPLDIPPLYESIDTEALDQLVDEHDGTDSDALLSFNIDDWNVFVRGDGRIRVCDATEPMEPEPVFAPMSA